MQLKNVLPGGFSDTFFAQILKHSLSNHKHIYIYMTNKLVTIIVIGPFCFTSTEARWLFRDGHNSHVWVPLYTLQALNTETCLNCL